MDKVQRGVLCASDDSWQCFSSFKLLYASLKLTSPSLPISIVDLGLLKEQADYVGSLPGVSLIPYADLEKYGPIPFAPYSIDRWSSWVKPCVLPATPYEETIYIDVDCICFRPIEGLFILGADRLMVTEDCANKAFPNALGTLPNKPSVYEKYPAKHRLPSGPFVNTGLIVYHWPRDRDFIDQWIAFTHVCSTDAELRDGISWWDQGVCQYVIEKFGWTKNVLRDVRWNHAAPMKAQRQSHESYDGPLGFVDFLKPGDNIIGHFAGYPKPWGDLRDTPLGEITERLKPYCQGYNIHAHRKI